MKSSGGGGTWEGLGGPVDMRQVTTNGIDPTLDACCQREIESNRYRSALDETLRRHDVTLMAERRRRHLVPNLPWGEGCRCCYDPDNDGGEYYALMKLREELAKEEEEEKLQQDEQQEENDTERKDEQDSDSDDEFDYLLDEDLPGEDGGMLAEMEERRRAELELELLHREAALQHGYGAHRQLHPARVLKAAGLGSTPRSAIPPPPAVVLHLFNEDSMVSASLDLFLERLADTNKGTKFLRCGGKSALLMDVNLAKQVLPTLHPTNDIPALVAIRDGVAIATCPKLQGLSDDERIDERNVQEWLHHAGVLLERPPPLEEVCSIRPEEMALYDYLGTSAPTLEQMQTKEGVEEGSRYDCGNPMCHKTFPHDHIGMKNEQQDGLVVQEEQILGETSKTNE